MWLVFSGYSTNLTSVVISHFYAISELIIHKCSLAFGIGITDLLEGKSALLSSYTITRKGEGQQTAKENGIEIHNLAPMFRKKIAKPHWVRYEYCEELQDNPFILRPTPVRNLTMCSAAN